VTNVELFFDLVYVFAVTQLSHYLLSHPSPAGALRTGLLLTMVWLAWAYTTWVTNWLDPERIAVRLLLLALVPASLVMSAAVPDAFGGRGLAVGAAYATMQIGRSAFAVVALNGQPLQRNYQRILAWCVVSGVLAILGGLKAGHARELLWVGAVGVDLAGGIAGFYTPGLGRSSTADWTIEGGHFAERCQASSSSRWESRSSSSGPPCPACTGSAGRRSGRSPPPLSEAWACGGCTSTAVRTRAPGSSRHRPIPVGWAAPRITSSTRSWSPGSS
jgi:hypothetical protein